MGNVYQRNYAVLKLKNVWWFCDQCEKKVSGEWGGVEEEEDNTEEVEDGQVEVGHDGEADGPLEATSAEEPAPTELGESRDGEGVRLAPPVGQIPEAVVVAEPPSAEAGVAEEGTAGVAPPPVATPPPRTVPRAKGRWPIVCVGDSMVKNAWRHMAMRGEKSKLVSLSGKGVGDIVQAARENMRGLEEGMLILQGGGNGLRHLGPEQTVQRLMECVREVKREKKVRVAVVGVMGRPRETWGYEELRRETNKLLQQEVLKLKIECSEREGDYGVSYLDMDGVLPPRVYARDGVHLDREGDRVMCRGFLEWVTATERLCRMREGSRRE